MANQTSHTRPQPVTPDSLTAAERAVLFNIETGSHSPIKGAQRWTGCCKTTSGGAECASPEAYNGLAPVVLEKGPRQPTRAGITMIT